MEKKKEKKKVSKRDIHINLIVKVLHDIDYLLVQIDEFQKMKNDKSLCIYKVNHPFVYNCIIESTVLTYRKLFEFFYKDLSNAKPLDAYAEYYFENDVDWHKVRNVIKLDDNAKDEIVKYAHQRGAHVTFNTKMDWNNILKYYDLFKVIYKKFKDNNIFDSNINHNVVQIANYQKDLWSLINKCIHRSKIEENQEIYNLICKVYNLGNINMSWVIKNYNPNL